MRPLTNDLGLPAARFTRAFRAAAVGLALSSALSAGDLALLDPERQLAGESWVDNRDFDWLRATVPAFESPDPLIDRTWYYRWEVLTKHLTYGSPDSGWSFTEFIDRPFWSGTFGAISCPAGHQLYEARWLRDPTYARDYARYWLRTPGAQPRRYSNWLADSVWQLHLVHPSREFTVDLLPGLVGNYEGWERERFVEGFGLFWQTGHDDGMETNINSRQTSDSFRGAPGFRPTLNSYLWADARAIARIGELAVETELASRFRAKAAALKDRLQDELWDPDREFFFHMFRDDEERDGHRVKARTLTYETGEFAGSPHGRELIGYVPWQFSLPDPGYEAAWKYLMDDDYFFAPFGPTTVEQHDPLFLISERCCVWSGQSWPYATTQTLVAFANLLADYEQDHVDADDWFRLFRAYARTHEKDGRPYIAEAAHPDTGSWEGHDAYDHSEHYFHSGFCDLLVTGLVGLRPRADDVLELKPLAPREWDYFALDGLPYRGHTLTILWDRDGTRYGRGAGLRVLVDGDELGSTPALGELELELPAAVEEPEPARPLVDWAVNNDGGFFPRLEASHSNGAHPLAKLHDGNRWYHVSPPNRFTFTGSPNDEDVIDIDLGVERRFDHVKVYFLDDGEGSSVRPPKSWRVEVRRDGAWTAIADVARRPREPKGRRANVARFPEIAARRIRVVVEHAEGARAGLTEVEVWGRATRPVTPPPPPEGNLALDLDGDGVPKASASHTSRFDDVEQVNNGRVVYAPSPHDRWTAYESTSASDWLAIDLGEERTVARAVLHIYDDRGGVQAPESYTIEWRDGDRWREIEELEKTPREPRGGQPNEARFEPVATRHLRVVFRHRGESRSGLTELELWGE